MTFVVGERKEKMGRMIDLDMAIDVIAIHKAVLLGGEANGSNDFTNGYALAYRHICELIAALPSAQPEIVRCKDCVLHGVCTYERGLGKDGFCNQGKRREDG